MKLKKDYKNLNENKLCEAISAVAFSQINCLDKIELIRKLITESENYEYIKALNDVCATPNRYNLNDFLI